MTWAAWHRTWNEPAYGRDALGVQSTADDVVTDTGEILDTATADHHDGVLLQGVAHAGNVSGDLVAVGQTHTGDLTQSGVGLLGGRGSHGGADASLLGRRQIGRLVLQSVQTKLQSGRSGLVSSLFSSLRTSWLKVGIRVFLLSFIISLPCNHDSPYFLRNAVKLFRKKPFLYAERTATTDAPTLIRHAWPSWDSV